MKKPLNDNNPDQYLKRSFIRRLPFGVKATFIKYWFYGALYFFCFMGLGNYVQNENLVLVTGLIGGVLFDIALYNIFLLIADTREEAGKWWFYKSKHFYSIFINVVILIGLFFLFYFIVVPINRAKPASLVWLFQEPLTSALLLTVLDTGIVWAKNGSIIFLKKLLKKDEGSKNKNYLKVLDVTPVSVSVEINNNDIYYANKPFNVLLNNEIILKKVYKNVFTIYDLNPDTQYHLTINRQTVIFTTPKIYKAYKVYENHNIQKVIDLADQYSLIIINKGTYQIKSLTLKNNLTLYLRKDAHLIIDGSEEDYPVIPAFNHEDEVYGTYKGEPHDMCQAIIHLDHLKNVKIVGEGSVECNLKIKGTVAPPNLVFINRSDNISLIGLNLSNSPQWTVHPFFSSNINLINLEIVNTNSVVDGIAPECSDNINIIGCHFANLKKGVAIKSGKNEIANKYHMPSKSIKISNCFMEHSDSAVCFGSEASSGISNVKITRSYFLALDTGVIVNTKRGSGKEAIVKDVNVTDIKMDGVKTPIVMNMFFSNNPKKESERTLTKKRIPIDEFTPYLNNFSFKNLEVKNFEYACGYFYGLPEKYIYEIKIIDSSFTPSEMAKAGSPTSDSEQYSKYGFIAKNVRSIELKNVKLNNITGKRINEESVSEITDDQK